MKPAFLFGPFIGSLSWELFRFAPYAIHLKHKFPDHNILVYTRPERFDLYGSYADILVPLRINNDNINLQQNFNLKGITQENYKKMVHIFERKYRAHYKAKEHFYPDIFGKRSLIKWQFPKEKMLYDFNPRVDNEKIMSSLMRDFDHIVVDTSGLYLEEAFYYIEKLDRELDKKIRFIIHDPSNSFTDLLFTSRELINLNAIKYDTSISLIGCLISAIKKSLFTVSVNFSDASHLSLLLGTKLYLCRDYSESFIKTINPLDTNIYLLNDYDFSKKETFEL